MVSIQTAKEGTVTEKRQKNIVLLLLRREKS